MTDSPSISVIVFSYNFEGFIGECLESLVNQTLQPDEILVCDDCSTDGSWEIIEEWARRYPDLIRATRHPENIGPGANGAFGKASARGDLISWIDGDDRWHPRKLQAEADAIEALPDAGGAYSDVVLIDDLGSPVGGWTLSPAAKPGSGDLFPVVFGKFMFAGTPAIFRNPLIRRRCFEEAGGHDTELSSYWDWDEKTRLAAGYPIAYTGQRLVEYRQHGTSFSRSHETVHLDALIQAYRKNLTLLASRTPAERAMARVGIESLIQQRASGLSAPPPDPTGADTWDAEAVWTRVRGWMTELGARERRTLVRSTGSRIPRLAVAAAGAQLSRGAYVAAGGSLARGAVWAMPVVSGALAARVGSALRPVGTPPEGPRGRRLRRRAAAPTRPAQPERG